MTITTFANRDHADEPLILNTKQAARLLGTSPRTMEDWRLTGLGPRFVKLGRMVRYQVRDLVEFIDRNSFGSTGEAKAA